MSYLFVYLQCSSTSNCIIDKAMENIASILERIKNTNAVNGINARGFKNGGNSVSVYKVVSTLNEPFDAVAMSEKMSLRDYDNPSGKYYGQTAEEIRAMWEQMGERSMAIGRKVDLTIQRFFSCMTYPYPSIETQREIFESAVRAINVGEFAKEYGKEYLGHINSFFEFIRILDGHDWELMGTEVPMHDPNSGILGRADCLLRQGERIVLIDWKTNKDISTTNSFQNMLGPMLGYESTKLNEFTMQIYLYVWMMRNVYGVNERIDPIIVKLNESNDLLNPQPPTILKPMIPYSDEMMVDVINHALFTLGSSR